MGHCLEDAGGTVRSLTNIYSLGATFKTVFFCVCSFYGNGPNFLRSCDK